MQPNILTGESISILLLYSMFLLSVCYRFAMWGRYVIVRLDIEQAPGILGYLNT